MRLAEVIQNNLQENGSNVVEFSTWSESQLREIDEFAKYDKISSVGGQGFWALPESGEVVEGPDGNPTAVPYGVATYTFVDTIDVPAETLVVMNASISDGLYYLRATPIK